MTQLHTQTVVIVKPDGVFITHSQQIIDQQVEIITLNVNNLSYLLTASQRLEATIQFPRAPCHGQMTTPQGLLQGHSSRHHFWLNVIWSPPLTVETGPQVTREPHDPLALPLPAHQPPNLLPASGSRLVQWQWGECPERQSGVRTCRQLEVCRLSQPSISLLHSIDMDLKMQHL